MNRLYEWQIDSETEQGEVKRHWLRALNAGHAATIWHRYVARPLAYTGNALLFISARVSVFGDTDMNLE